ncbi:hypothetical protein BZA77DRAFT_325774 [Pyronema omphalodes]|nr:hypothetical protein BZA77DRAFT_325692 [Pyronema omphalodes]KAI5811974.1 hypothetical protein BZA77DRAFT_325774 [Pyronema omphalodes]
MTYDLNPLFEKRQIIGITVTLQHYEFSNADKKYLDNCKYLFGKDVDPMVVTDYIGFENGSWHSRVFVIDRNKSFSTPLPAQTLSGVKYSDVPGDWGSLVATHSSPYPFTGRYYEHSHIPCHHAIHRLHLFTSELVKQKREQEAPIEDQIILEVEEKLQRLAANTTDDAVKDRLREKLLYRARSAMARKQEKLESDIENKAQELVDTLQDEDGDEGETAIERIIHNIRQPPRNRNQPSEIDWRGECVSNILLDAQKKLREKLRDQKQDLTTKFEAEMKEKIDDISSEHAHADAEKEAVIRDLTEKLDAKSQALEQSCTEVEQERGFRKTLEDALEVFHHTEQQRRQELVRVKAELERQASQLRDVLEEHSRCPSTGNPESSGCDTMTEEDQYTPAPSTVGGTV